MCEGIAEWVCDFGRKSKQLHRLESHQWLILGIVIVPKCSNAWRSWNFTNLSIPKIVWCCYMLLQFTANHPRSLLSWRMCPCDITTSPSSPFISKDWAEKSSFSSTHLRKLGSCHMSEDLLQTKFHTKVDWSPPTWKSSKCQQMKKLTT